MPFFPESPIDIDDMFANDNWVVAQGEYDGKPIVVRINAALKPFAGHEDFALKIGFALPLNHPNPAGLPDPAENDYLAELEDHIVARVNDFGTAVQALAITMGTFKEFIFYAQPGIDVQAVHELLMQEIDSHDVQCYAEIEEAWETYLDWAHDL